MGGPAAKEYPVQYFMASAMAATGCYPLLRSAAIGQSGFCVAAMNVGGFAVPQAFAAYAHGFMPPYKGMVATVVGMTDVIRNEQFKTHLGLRRTTMKLHREMGLAFMTRGLGKNMVAVALPVGCTIFFTDALIQWSQHQEHLHNSGRP